MLENIHISGFRRYDDFEIGGFKEVNFLLGDNNSGKTSILESVFTWACGQNIPPMMSIPLARARYTRYQHAYWITEEVLSMVNDRHKLPLTMSFEGVYNKKNERFVHKIYPSELLAEFDTSYKNVRDKAISYNTSAIKEQTVSPNMPMFNTVIVCRWEVEHEKKLVNATITSPLSAISTMKPFVVAKFIDVLSHTDIGENVQMYASLKRENLLSEVVDRINKVFPEIVNFDMIPYPDGSQAPVSVVKNDGIALPLYSCGDGLQRWFYTIGALTINKNAIICIDEIDTGLHPSAQIEFCRNVVEYAIKNKVQLFITTHNLEFVDKFIEAIMHDEIAEKVNLYTMRNAENNQVKVRTMSAIDAFEAREEYNMELR